MAVVSNCSESVKRIQVSDITVEVVRKKIKSLYIRIYPPEGTVRISVPMHVTNHNAYLAVMSRLSWIKKRQEELKQQPRQTQQEYIKGESHYFRGKRYMLEVIERKGKHEIQINDNAIMTMLISPGASLNNRALTLERWYRQQMKTDVAQLLDTWLPVIDRPLTDWGIKRMKTKWGSCNITAKRIWLNLELIKKSPECLEYVLVHELVHLHERYHNDNFFRLMDKFLPHWRKSRDLLNKE